VHNPATIDENSSDMLNIFILRCARVRHGGWS
jgi:hypothetical protein